MASQYHNYYWDVQGVVESVLDCARVTTVACLEKVANDYEVIQNNAFRTIFKKAF